MAETKTKTLPKRSEIKEEYTWRLEDIYNTDEEWEKEFQELKQLFPTITKYEGKLGESADTLYEALKLQDEISIKIGKLYTYAHMRSDQDTANTTYQGLNDRAVKLATEVGSTLAFIVPELLSYEEEKIKGFIEEHERLKLYEHAIEDINRGRPHTLSAKEEALLAQASEVMGNPADTFGKLNNADLTFPTIKDENGEEAEITHGRYIRFLESSDRNVRRDAFKAVHNTYGNFKNTLASTLSGAVKKHNFNARIRKYSSAREAALSANNIPENVYDTLVETINDNLHLLQRYAALRKKVLGIDEVHLYDMYTPLVKDIKMEIPFDEAKQLVLESLEPMGSEYVNIVKEGYENRWIDVYENKGKRSGAYSSGSYATNPYVLLNWQDNVNNLFTLTHEIGHSVHSYYTRKHQPYPYGNYSIFVAEVASTCNEALLNDYMLKRTNDEKEKLYLLNHYLEGFRGTVFRQTMFAEFEHLIHQKAQEGEALTSEFFTKNYYELNKKYFGENVHVDEEIGMEWARIPHFYYNYYVYQYATGFAAASALSKQILEEGQPAVDRYLDYLKAGSSDYPIEVLKRAGVDMTTSEPIKQALNVFEQKLTEMEKLIDKV